MNEASRYGRLISSNLVPRGQAAPRGPYFFGTVLLAMLLGSGCTVPKRAFEPAVPVNPLSDIEFTHYLATIPVATVDEGYRAALLLTGDSTRWPTFHQRREELYLRGAARRHWKLEADSTLDKGTLAHLLRVMCSLPPSLNERLWGRLGWGDRRYALETCIYEKIIPPGRAGEALTGGELLTAVNAAQERLDRNEAAR
jgi:hypothetical protein